MTWVTIAALLAQYTLPFVDKLIAKWTANPNGQVTPQEWAELMALGQNNALTMMKASLSRAGIPETDPRAIALLAAVPV